MKPDDIGKGFEFFLDALLRWWDCVLRPSSSVQKIIDLAATDDDAVKRVANFWLTPFFLALLLQSWVYQLYGLGLSNVGFHATFTVFGFLVLLAWAFAIYLALKIFRIRVPFRETLITYAVYVSTYAPFFALLASPTLAQAMGVLKALKVTSPEIADVPKLFYAGLVASQNTTLGVAVIVCMAILTPATIALLALVLESLSSRFNLNREKVLSAGSFAMILVLPFIFLLSLVSNFLVYAYI